MRLIILKKSSVKRTLAIALLLIMAGIALAHPFNTQAAQRLVYLYPMPQNNPVSQYGLFCVEDHPEIGAGSIGDFERLYPGSQIVVGIPPGMQLSTAMIGDRFGKYLVNIIKKRLDPAPARQYGKKSYNRTPQRPDSTSLDSIINPSHKPITEEIPITIIRHYNEVDEKSFERSKEVNKKINVPADPKQDDKTDDSTAQTLLLFGNTLILGGLALAAKVLLPLLL